ncbi:hypothetical protein ACWDTP_31755, partial [Mycobacterium sp. NPDC003449]
PRLTVPSLASRRVGTPKRAFSGTDASARRKRLAGKWGAEMPRAVNILGDPFSLRQGVRC